MNKSVLAIALSTCLLSACSSTPSMSSLTGDERFSESFVRAHLIKDKTTLAEVASLYGEPESRNNYSDGSSSLTYRKRTPRDQLKSLYNLVDAIPGADSAKSALAQASNKTYDLDKASSSLKELSGNKDLDSNYLSVTFDKNGIVRSWSQ